MKKQYVFFLITALGLGSAHAQKEPYSVKTFKSAEIKALDIRTSDGGIFVKGSDKATSTVEVFVDGHDMMGRKLSQEEIDDRLKNYTLIVEKQGSTLLCHARTPQNLDWKKSLEITFRILAPEDIDANLKTSDGALSLRNVHGNLDFSTSDGDIKLEGLSGQIKGRSSDGDISIRQCKGNIALSTSDGDIDVAQIKGRIDLKTSDGDITINEVKGELDLRTSDGEIQIAQANARITASTSDGDIQFDQISGDLEAKTGDGNIRGSFDTLGDYLRLSSGDGNIDLQLPLDKGMNLDLHGDPVSLSTKNNFNGKFEKHNVQGTLNGGGTDVRIHTSDGHLRIN
ncbi:DUF4097 domain-containing protein [Marinilongibacter aquaticus]|uniref:DUF4097 family beta strand repeat-containing protein n=1 Tax=Marinilongibacter aquaticus TaxID=2975157 RepID=UPI0021BD79B9|nr:DUF4097 domain-containing protein [Marinilongibacter aquaticus]UBM57299.1 DUF4097 domain-containing protein [Marinilongibacter aquaticus]